MFFRDKIWDEQKFNKEKAGFLAQELNVSPLITGILLGRGLNTADEMREFLYGRKEPFYNPMLMQDMEKACTRIEQALANGEKITVYGDYDVDGISASSLLYLYLRDCGAKVDTYIPERKSEGYGLNDEALKTIFAGGTSLLITVDCGISAVHEVSNKPVGLDIIITDHHAVPSVVPEALAVVNPHRSDCQYPFKELSGVGVAFKLCQALAQRRGSDWCKWTELVALGTVADIVPLADENREIVRRGLAAMATTDLIGLKVLIKNSLGEGKEVTAENISFGLAPRLNAVGRLEHAKSAVELLTTDDESRAQEIANFLNEENLERQKISKEIFDAAEAMLAAEKHIDTAIVLASEGWHPGVIGVVASRLTEKYYLPTLLFSIDNGMAKGSCRSIPGLNIHDAIASLEDLVEQYGGHHQAAGLTIKEENLPEFKEKFLQYVKATLKQEDFEQHQRIDYVLSDQQGISLKDVKDLELLEPSGCENQTPIFAYRNARLEHIQIMGENRNHLRFNISKGNDDYCAVMWNRADLLSCLNVNGTVADITFQPKINEFRGEVSVQLHVLTLHQPINVFDFRYSRNDKYSVLSDILRMENYVDIFVNGDIASKTELFKDKLGDNSKYLHFHNFSDFEMPKGATVVCFDLPVMKLREFVAKCGKQEVGNLVLLYNNNDLRKFNITHPDLQTMRKAYLLIDSYYKSHNEFDYRQFLQGKNNFSDVIFLILAELGLVVLDGTTVKEVKFLKTDITNSVLYKKLEQERSSLEKIYTENIHCSRSEFF